MSQRQLLNLLPQDIKQLMINEDRDLQKLQELRFRVGQPFLYLWDGIECLPKRLCIIGEKSMKELVERIARYSLYAYEEEMKQGFITIEGGHRVGFSGKVIVEHGKVKNFRYISSINVRVCHEIIGCSAQVFPYVMEKNEAMHVLIVSPPGCGKTTILRDLIRQLSDGTEHIKGKSVCVIDERSEIGGCYKGVPQNHLGMRTDILDGCPKTEGLLMVVRAMNPEIIAVDEIGTYEDIRAVEYAMHCGCKMLATVHGTTLDELRRKPGIGELIGNQKFERYVVLGKQNKVGEILGIYDKNYRLLFGDSSH